VRVLLAEIDAAEAAGSGASEAVDAGLVQFEEADEAQESLLQRAR
jgi:hypothetical protein